MTTWDEEFDFISVGSGAGGLAAAIAGADAGLRPLVLEKSPRLGGNTVWSYGLVWAGNNDLAHAEGIEDTDEKTQAYLDYLGGGRNDSDATRSFVKHAPEAVRYFQTKANIPFYLVRKLPDHYYPLGEGSLPEGRSLQAQLFEIRERRSLARPSRNRPLRPWPCHLRGNGCLGWPCRPAEMGSKRRCGSRQAQRPNLRRRSGRASTQGGA